jgi:hypothetical protein
MFDPRKCWGFKPFSCLGLSLALSFLCGWVSADDEPKIPDHIRKELERRDKVWEWFTTNVPRPTQREYLIEIHRPIIEGCREDYERNMKYAERFYRRAQDARDKGMEKSWRRSMMLAKAFKEYAEQNRTILEAVREENTEAMTEAMKAIAKIEQRIFDISGEVYKRKWLMPWELTGSPPPIDAPAEEETDENAER